VEEGPDPGCIGLPPAPALGSSELCAEIAELYAMALVRDMTFADLSNPASNLYYYDEAGAMIDYRSGGQPVTVANLVDALKALPWFNPNGMPFGGTAGNLSTTLSGPEMLRRGRGKATVTAITAGSLFRGSAPGSEDADYLSKFLTLRCVDYGVQSIDQSILPPKLGLDYMTSWAAWLDVQNGADLRAAGAITKDPNERKVIETGRHLARYVQRDQLYQAYHVAALILAQSGFPRSVGFPEGADKPTRDAFASFGNPHLLALFAEVSSRALKAVRRQKYQIHRRARPERLAALLTLAANGQSARLGDAGPAVNRMLTELQTAFGPFLTLIAEHNARQNGDAWKGIRHHEGMIQTTNKPDFIDPKKNYLLPMAFAEGSPMHPAYGAGHATVAGACITVLKAFYRTVDPVHGWQRTPLEMVPPFKDTRGLTVEGELNKLAANISIGRNMAGVHYYSDYYESLRLGERVAVGILHEQMTNYVEPVSMYLHSFDGDRITISTEYDGTGAQTVNLIATADTAAWWLRHTGKNPVMAASNWMGV